MQQAENLKMKVRRLEKDLKRLSAGIGRVGCDLERVRKKADDFDDKFFKIRNEHRRISQQMERNLQQLSVNDEQQKELSTFMKIKRFTFGKRDSNSPPKTVTTQTSFAYEKGMKSPAMLQKPPTRAPAMKEVATSRSGNE